MMRTTAAMLECVPPPGFEPGGRRFESVRARKIKSVRARKIKSLQICVSEVRIEVTIRGQTLGNGEPFVIVPTTEIKPVRPFGALAECDAGGKDGGPECNLGMSGRCTREHPSGRRFQN
jgi:hypothetical protein